jgi:hypothetical protein
MSEAYVPEDGLFKHANTRAAASLDSRCLAGVGVGGRGRLGGKRERLQLKRGMRGFR